MKLSTARAKLNQMGEENRQETMQAVKRIFKIAGGVLLVANILLMTTSLYLISIGAYLVFIVLTLNSLHKGLDYRKTKAGEFIRRYRGKLGKLDTHRNINATSLSAGGAVFIFVSVLSIFITKFIPNIVLGSVSITGFQILGIWLAMKFLDAQINAVELYTEEELAARRKDILSNPDKYGGILSLTDPRNTAGTTNPSSPNY